MCDMRSPPKVVNILTQEIVARPEQCKKATWCVGDWVTKDYYGPHVEDVVEPGLYFISATGAGYGYFDGSNWHYYNSKEYLMDFSESTHLGILCTFKTH